MATTDADRLDPADVRERWVIPAELDRCNGEPTRTLFLLLAAQTALASELDRERHEFTPENPDSMWCGVCTARRLGNGQAGDRMHRTARLVLAEVAAV